MTAAELTEWAAFERVHGPVLVHDRVDALSARLCYVVALAAGAKVKPKDFEVRWDQAPRGETVRRGFETLMAMARGRRADH